LSSSFPEELDLANTAENEIHDKGLTSLNFSCIENGCSSAKIGNEISAVPKVQTLVEHNISNDSQ